LYRTRFNYSRL